MRKLQLSELVSLSILSAFFVLAGGAVLTIVGVIEHPMFDRFYIFALLITISGLIAALAILMYSAIKTKEQKPYGFYNVISDVVEFHIGSKVKRPIGLRKSIRVMKSYAEELNKDIVFCTNLLDTEKINNLEKRFNVKIDIYPVSKFKKVLFYFPYLMTFVWVKKVKRYPLVKGVVRISK
ncbi:hypothetical protein [Paenibacillus gallinarum]|uniref:Uncharacterized protein n=1 Tax=Paenibacillus gallinarum TaxID=2762232 RepID=A0ABR8T3I3_9BACL|nr:hypothetical protein [Paenibacillus gallinarum]MBD7970257.1 hypothetical protein [Paenibacillus gallinarum]